MSSGDPSILLVDRDLSNTRPIAKKLIGGGFSVTIALDAGYARGLLESNHFDALIVDLRTSHTTDVDLIKWAAAHRCTGPIIALTDFDSPAVERSAEKRGADVVLRKPVDTDCLLEFLGPKQAADAFSGNVEGVDLLEYVQFLLLCSRKTVLEVYAVGGARGRIFFADGRICHAAFGPLEGEEALFKCLCFKGGRFSNLPWQEPERVTIHKPGDFLLLEAARLRDEERQDVSKDD